MVLEKLQENLEDYRSTLYVDSAKLFPESNSDDIVDDVLIDLNTVVTSFDAIQGKTDKRQSMREEGSTESYSSLPTYDDSHPPDNLELINSATKKRVLNNALQKILVGKCFAHVATVETINSF